MRIEFKASVKAAAWLRSGGACEAEGRLYGLPPGVRCGEDMTIKGVEYDHINPVEQSQDAELSNCAAVCPSCHRWKSSHRDIPMLAKGKRLQKKARNIRPRQSRPMPGSRASGIKKCMSGEVVRR